MLSIQLMALLVPTRSAGLGLATSPPAHVRLRRRTIPTIHAAISNLNRTTGDKEVDWVEATSSFFQHDSRPIMLFDGILFLPLVKFFTFFRVSFW